MVGTYVMRVMLKICRWEVVIARLSDGGDFDPKNPKSSYMGPILVGG
jgi:hypothetical protein